MSETVALIGASDNPSRYAYKAMKMLAEHGHTVVLVNPFKHKIDDHPCLASVSDHDGTIDTITLYVNPDRFEAHLESVIRKSPRRVIMNPGTEDDAHEKRLQENGIEVERSCTLVLLSTGQFQYSGMH